MLVVPFLMAGTPLVVRMPAILVALISTLRAIDLAKEKSLRPASVRVWHMLAVYDTKRATRCQPTVKVRRALEAVAWFGLCLAIRLLPLSRLSRVTIWLLTVLFLVAVIELITRVIEVSWALVGIQSPPMHKAPYLSRTLREFWGARWNKVVSDWLREHCYKPLARRGWPQYGLQAAFAASGLMHGYIVLIVMDWWWALPIAAFFLIQAPLIWIEDVLRIRNRSAAVGHVWTMSALLISSPLFTEPLLREMERVGR